jgi:membrane-associated phospholipid phosphatase
MRLLVLINVAAVVLSNSAESQKDSTPPNAGQHVSRAWIVPIGVVASSTIDGEMREWALRTHSRSLDRLARAVNPLGTAHVLIPAMALFYAGAELTHETTAEHTAIETAAAYVASDAVESILKPIIGRQRPHVRDDSHRFHPFTKDGDWHSMPSAHVAHITAIATAISMQTSASPITALCDGVVALVAWDRIYEDQHWTSDVTATAALTAFISRETVRWISSRWNRQ